MKNLIIILLLISYYGKAQHVSVSSANGAIISGQTSNSTIPQCLTDVIHSIHRQQLGYLQNELIINTTIQNSLTQNRGGGTLTIPVVVHVIHNNGPENISDAQVVAGIEDLNAAFANNGFYASADGVNTNIQFCLAIQDPNGNFTNGITRTVSTLTEMTAETQDLALKNLVRWDPTRYLNIWLVREINSVYAGSGVAGYATLPFSHGYSDDGIVNEAGFFAGSQGGNDAEHNSKIHVHEAGHYLGLYHTFEGGCTNNNCLTDGDRVCDTPPDNSNAAYNCFGPPPPNTCNTDDADLSNNNPFRPVANGGLGDQSDMIANYLDYGFQTCQNMFTQGQSDRMNAALTSARASLLQSNGCINLCASPLYPDFTLSSTSILLGGTITCDVNFVLPWANYTWLVDGAVVGTGPSYTFNGQTPGIYAISLIATNGAPECTASSNTPIEVTCPVEASFTISTGAPYPVGTTIDALNTSTQASQYQWVLDGGMQGSTLNFSQQFNTPGGHNLFLIAGNGACSDTSGMVFFTIGDCNLSPMNQNLVFTHLVLNFENGTGEPTVGFSQINTNWQESTTSISDPDGNLLFYSDGVRAFNRLGMVMPNGSGLLGHPSSTQSCLATPYPGHPNWYCLFTNDAFENNSANGLRYSIIDITLDNGLGDIIPSTKNTLVRNDVSEMLTGTFHANGHDIWIVTRKGVNNIYFAYLLTDQGLSNNPVTSIVGLATNFGVVGGGKFSADGNLFASFTNGLPDWSILLANFNRSSGTFTNGRHIWLPYTTGNNQVHNFEFSPDNSKLYLSLWQVNELWQYDLSAGNLADIEASKTIVGPYASTIYGQLARGNNGKIYLSTTAGTLDYIANPNDAGIACNYTTGTVVSQINGFSCLSMSNMIQGLGQAYIPQITGKTSICPSDSVTYHVPYLSQNESVVWTYTGNGTFVDHGNHTATLSNASGQNQLSAVITGNCGITYDTIQIVQVATQQPILGNDTVICGSIQLVPQQNFEAYLWNTGSIGSILLATQPGTYWVETTDTNACVARDSITLSTSNPIALNLGNDTTVCGPSQFLLDAGSGYQSYQWQDGADSSTYMVTQPGTYWVNVSDGCASYTDSINVIGAENNINLNLNYNGDTVLCDDQLPFILNAPSGYQSYQWQNGSVNSSINITQVGTYYVTVTNTDGCQASDTLRVIFCVVGLTEPLPNDFVIFPNPAQNEVNIFSPVDEYPEHVTLINYQGQVVCVMRPQSNIIPLPNQLAAGLYTLVMQIKDKQFSRRLLIVR